MMPELLTTLIAGLLTLLVTVIASIDFVRLVLYRVLGKPWPKKTYAVRLSELTQSLTKASAEVDSILAELSRVAKEKQFSVKQLEQGLSDLEKQENELKDRIATLENVPIPAAEHFAKLMESGEHRTAKRDYVLFGSGVLVTTLIAIIIRLVSG